MTAEISVIVPNLNSPVIASTLAALHEQDFDLARVEVLVVGLDEPGLVQEDELVRSISTGRPTPPGAARNIGVQASGGDLLCFTDADCVPRPHWLRTLATCFTDPEVTVVGGGVAFPPDNYWRLADNISTFHPYLHTSPPGMREQLPSLNLGLRRRVWADVGPFDERYSKAGEDVDWTTRARLAGHSLRFEPAATVTHIPQRSTFGDLWHHAVGFGQYSVKLDNRYRGARWRPFVLDNWLLTLIASPVMAGWVTARAFSQRSMLRYAHTIPAVFVAKIGWCWGAAQRLRGRESWSRALPID